MPQTGIVEIWMYDTGKQGVVTISDGTYYFRMGSHGAIKDYKNFVYRFTGYGESNWQDSGIRTIGWHKFTYALGDKTKLYIDDKFVAESI